LKYTPYFFGEDMNKLFVVLTLLWLQNIFFTNVYAFDSLGYRYYHDLDNEHDGSKFRAYATKKFYQSKLKFAYERKRTGTGIEAGTWFIDHEYKF
tara:strand:+ start:158 stop:442 length:285 start_codon:yes stop_codon:yes gene_type:complete